MATGSWPSRGETIPAARQKACAMINIYKLEKLPRNQRLRKVASIFAAAERRIIADAGNAGSTQIAAVELGYFSDIAKFISRDPLLAGQAGDALGDAADVFMRVAVSGEFADNADAIRRTLNCARHLLLAETGHGQADWDFLDSDGRLDPARRQVFPGMHVYLDDIRSPFNVGAMFRSAESFGAEKIFVSPFCADPKHARAHRTSMGCVDVLPWERRDFFATQAEAPARADAPVFALETGGTPLADFAFPRQGLLIAGSEELGVSPQALAAADASLGRVSIPCYGAKGSLNVSVAFGIVMQAWAARLGTLCEEIRA